MATGVTGRTRPTKVKKQERAQKRKRNDVDAEQLVQAVQKLVRMSNSSSSLTSADRPGRESSCEQVRRSPSLRTYQDRSESSTLYHPHARSITNHPSRTQRFRYSWCCEDRLWQDTGFLVPVLENLYRSQCIGADAGLSAMIISPTRELAIQIFDVLVKIGRKGHLFAAGLVIGGKGLQEERDALTRMNIVVCTPGRILQHLSQTAMFNCDNLKMLVLDEADRILDMGFQRDVDAIVEYLPPDRQTLLFSATQTKRVSDLARLSLKDPEYITMSEATESATPKTLQQNYIVTPLSDKLDTLWSFIQSTKKAKILVFLSSAKQVRFVYESFRHMQPGIPLLHLHGRQKQTARLDITAKFSAAKTSCLFATDVVARGLDFPAVDWVVQVDCPEDADTYIHRVGRTARYERNGRAVLFLDPSEEEGMLSRLESKKIPIESINVRQKKQRSIRSQLQNMCFKDPTLKYLGQKAFTSYVKSIYLQKDKEVFKLNDLDLASYAASLGLPGAPKVKFVKGEDAKAKKNAPRMAAVSDVDEEELLDGELPSALDRKKNETVRTRYDRMFERRNQDVLADHYASMVRDEGDDDEDDMTRDVLSGEQNGDDDLFSVKRRIPADEPVDAESSSDRDFRGPDNPTLAAKSISIPGAQQAVILDSKRREKLLKSKKKLLKLKGKGSKLVFDDDGDAHELYELEDEDQFKAAGAADEQRKRFLSEEAARVREADIADKAVMKDKRRAKRDKRKEREQAEQGETAENTTSKPGQDALADFIADAQSSADDGSDDADREPAQKRPKKWFEEEGKVSRNRDKEESNAQPETLEDLEALASGLLAR